MEACLYIDDPEISDDVAAQCFDVFLETIEAAGVTADECIRALWSLESKRLNAELFGSSHRKFTPEETARSETELRCEEIWNKAMEAANAVAAEVASTYRHGGAVINVRPAPVREMRI